MESAMLYPYGIPEGISCKKGEPLFISIVPKNHIYYTIWACMEIGQNWLENMLKKGAY